MRTKFDSQLEKLHTNLIEISSLCKQAISFAINALIQNNVALAHKAIDIEKSIDDMEREIEGLCLKLLLQQQPVARDLRQISAALKMITDMERIGDQAADISEIAICMSKAPYIKKLEHIQAMAKETTVMVVESINAYVTKDIELANEASSVCVKEI